ncbi:MAG: hypothetical protein ACXVB9_08890 [Bdellovibrionota bacterium]
MLVTRLLIIGALFASTAASAAQLNYGKYFGTIQMDGLPDAIAVSLDAFVTQVKDPTVYPALDVIVRANLGGFSSSEYVGYDFHDPVFNFEKGILQLSDSRADLTATLAIKNTDTETILEGPVLHRLTNARGKMRVVMELDDSSPPALPPGHLASTLKGEYQGQCGTDSADLQVETARGLGATASGNALTGYSITGRMGYSNGPLCHPDNTNQYCGLYVYSTGTYSPFKGRLTMQGPLGTLDCTKVGDSLQCNVFGYDKSGACKLKKKSEAPAAPVQIPSSIFLAVPAEQMNALPDPAPPGNDALVSALDGDFYGFLHFENRDLYQLMEMNVSASTSTENPHVQNQVNVAPTILLRAGSSWDSTPLLSLAYPQRVFFLSDGFAFEANDSVDYYAVIGQWRAGYIAGVLYSRSFGRVGTFELGKGPRPVIPAGMNMLSDPSGIFRGPKDAPEPWKDHWSISIEIPNLAPEPDQTGVPLRGGYNGPGQMSLFEASSLDLNTGELGFLIKQDKGSRLVTGELIPGGKLKLTWPVGPALGAPMSGYGTYTYEPKARQ